MVLIDLDEYIRCVLRLKGIARRLRLRPQECSKSLAMALEGEADVLIGNLKENGYIEDFDLSDLQ